MQDESRRAHLAAESASGQQKEAERQLQRSQDGTAQARSEAQELGIQLRLEKERAQIAEQRRKLAVVDKEELENRLAAVQREVQQRKEHEVAACQVNCIILPSLHAIISSSCFTKSSLINVLHGCQCSKRRFSLF